MSRLVQVWLGDDLQATLDPNQTFPPRRDKGTIHLKKKKIKIKLK